jgi:phosphoglycolate phosphatase
MEQATLIPFAREAVAAMKDLGFATAIWTNNDRVVADVVLARFGLLPYLDLVVTRDDVTDLKPDPDGLRVVRERWPRAERIVVVGDSWVDGAAAQAGGVPFIAYRADAAELARRSVVPTAWISSLLDLPAALAD